MKNIMILILLGFLVLMSCDQKNELPEMEKELSKSEQVLEKAYIAHGGELYETAHFKFTFRDKELEFKNDGGQYYYRSRLDKNDTIFIDEISNGKFSRKVNGEVAELSEKKTNAYIETLNSIIYFATLPHKLNDEAVNLSYKGEVSIDSQMYKVLEVTFDEEGGGTDFDDTYYYWFNSETHLIDYLAYNYQVNEGGVRFRVGNNKRKVGGVVFQDYVNYKAEIGTPLEILPALYLSGKLEKLSEINTENVEMVDQ